MLIERKNLGLLQNVIKERAVIRRLVAVFSILLVVLANPMSANASQVESFSFNLPQSGLGFKADWYLFENEVDGSREIEASHYSITKELADFTLHVNNANREHEQFNELGIGWRGLTIYGFSGHAKGMYLGANNYQNVDPYLFHGGSKQEIKFSGATLTQSLYGGMLHVSGARVNQQRTAQRSAWQIGYDRDRWYFAWIQTKLDDQSTGKGIGIGWRGKRFSVDYQHLSSYTDVSMSRLDVTNNRGNVDYGLSFVMQRSPLYESKNENRVMLKFGYTFGAGLMRASEADSSEQGESTSKEEAEAESAKATKKGLLIGAGLVAGAVLISSGDSDSDNDSRLATQHEAARNVLNAVNPESVSTNREIGGYIYRNADGSYSHTEPRRGSTDSLYLPPPVEAVPSGTSATASYHTHAAFDSRYDNEIFSPEDIRLDEIFNIDGYLGTPAGALKYHNVNTGTTEELGTIAN